MAQQPSNRARRVAELLQQELSRLIRTELRDPRLEWITITKVAPANDIKSAKVFFSAMPGTDAEAEPEAVRESLEKAGGYLRGELGRRLDLRYAPELHFVPDDSLAHGDRINRLLRSLSEGNGDDE
jgi:ribosome-binding factor A